MRNAGVTTRHRALFVGAHPDDIEIGAGGLVQRLLEERWDVRFLVATADADASKAAGRRREAIAAARRLGVAKEHIVFLNLPDRDLAAAVDAPSRIRDAIVGWYPEEKKSPQAAFDLVVTHTASDAHQDHVACHRHVVAAVRVPTLHFGVFTSAKAAVHESAVVCVDTTRFFQRKEEAFEEHASQLSTLHGGNALAALRKYDSGDETLTQFTFSERFELDLPATPATQEERYHASLFAIVGLCDDSEFFRARLLPMLQAQLRTSGDLVPRLERHWERTHPQARRPTAPRAHQSRLGALVDAWIGTLRDDLHDIGDPYITPTITYVPETQTIRARWTQDHQERQYDFALLSEGTLVVLQGNGARVSYRQFLAGAQMANLAELARTILATGADSTRADRQVRARTREADGAVVEGTAESILGDGAAPSPFLSESGTRLVFLKGEAGAGKSSVLLNATRECAQRYLDGTSPYLSLYVSARGKSLVNIMDVLAKELDFLRTRFRASWLAPLCRHGLLVPLVDSFDDLVSHDGDAFASLRQLGVRLNGSGVLVLAARNTFDEQAFIRASSPDVRWRVVPIELVERRS